MKVRGGVGSRDGAVLLLVLLVNGVAGCGGPLQSVTVEAFEDFSFVRDDAGILPAGQRTLAQGRLHEIAQRSGVFGVIVTVGENEMIDPPRIYTPIVEEVRALGGQALITICTRLVCGPAAGTAHTDGLDEAVALVGSDAAPGEGRNLNRGLRDWLDYVAAVAEADR